jgi:DNA-binding CsgD family transcriptional regulator
MTDQLANDLAHDKKFFEDAAFPALLVNHSNLRVRKANQACQQWLGYAKSIGEQSIEQLFAGGERLAESLRSLSAQKPLAEVCGIAGRDGKTPVMDVSLSLSRSGEPKEAVLIFRLAKPNSEGLGADAIDAVRLQRAEEMNNTLSKQLSWERWVRQIICKLHATLDRDTLLQTVVDGFGRALGASRCLIVRTDGLVSPMVTHEYVEPDISPLGLGRTGQFPPAAISIFRHKVGAIADLSALEKSGQLTVDEYEYFAENGVRGMAGAPIASHGINYGVIVILECGPIRKWAPHELDMLEIAASQTAVALGHSQSYLQLKDQLFNMNLLGNLTQQLTSTLELVSRGTKADGIEEKKQSSNAPPLSLRELEVLKLIASGLANREIAQRLFLTESTVELHASRIRKKLKLKSRTALVKYACDNGLA